MTKIWELRRPSPHAPELAQEAGITPLQAQLLINRGIRDSASARSFLAPRLSSLMDPMLLKDMDRAVAEILRAIEGRQPITIFGDYDADGVTATALLMNFFSILGIPVSFYIPNRLTEGYGLNLAAVRKMAGEGTGLIITVDCGTANRTEIESAMGQGMRVVVTDHHQVPVDFDPICPVINPHRADSSFPFRDLAGVGIAFYLAMALRAALRERGWFRDAPEPDLKHYLDLVALGTVADMVPLLDQNRVLVRWGIERMKASCWPGIRALQESAAVKASRIRPYDLAFRLGPRLNAAGRLESAVAGVQLLTTQDPALARDVAARLNALNNERQRIEQDILQQIEDEILSAEDVEGRKSLVLSGRNWHRGVLGIVASRLVERYHRPVLVLDVREGQGMGSGRSIEGFNLHKALTALRYLFERFGGHYHAVGFTLDGARVASLAEGLERLAQERLSDQDLIPRIEMDAVVSLGDLTLESAKQVERLSPFGPGNPEPVFYGHNLRVMDSRVVGGSHLKLRVKQGGRIMEAIGFGLGHRHPLQGKHINMAFSQEINEWDGYQKVQLRIVDLEIKGRDSKLVQDMGEM